MFSTPGDGASQVELSGTFRAQTFAREGKPFAQSFADNVSKAVKFVRDFRTAAAAVEGSVLLTPAGKQDQVDGKLRPAAIQALTDWYTALANGLKSHIASLVAVARAAQQPNTPTGEDRLLNWHQLAAITENVLATPSTEVIASLSSDSKGRGIDPTNPIFRAIEEPIFALRIARHIGGGVGAAAVLSGQRIIDAAKAARDAASSPEVVDLQALLDAYTQLFQTALRDIGAPPQSAAETIAAA